MAPLRLPREDSARIREIRGGIRGRHTQLSVPTQATAELKRQAEKQSTVPSLDRHNLEGWNIEPPSGRAGVGIASCVWCPCIAPVSRPCASTQLGRPRRPCPSTGIDSPSGSSSLRMAVADMRASFLWTQHAACVRVRPTGKALSPARKVAQTRPRRPTLARGQVWSQYTELRRGRPLERTTYSPFPASPSTLPTHHRGAGCRWPRQCEWSPRARRRTSAPVLARGRRGAVRLRLQPRAGAVGRSGRGQCRCGR